MPAPPATGKKLIDTGLKLPVRAHLPGAGTTPDKAPLERARALAPAITDARRWRANPAYLYGHELFAAGFYWEAHEVWEAVWLACRPNSPERLLLQALIARANARLKRAMDKPDAARRIEAEAAALDHELALRLPAGRKTLMGVKIVAVRPRARPSRRVR